MKLKKMLKTFLANTNIVLANIDEPVDGNSYTSFFPTVFRGIRTVGTALELREEVNSWNNIDNYEVILAGITDRIGEGGRKDKFIVLYYRIEK